MTDVASCCSLFMYMGEDSTTIKQSLNHIPMFQFLESEDGSGTVNKHITID